MGRHATLAQPVREGRQGEVMKKFVAALAVAGMMLAATAVQADTKSENLEGFALGSPNGQGGWSGPTGLAAPL